MIRLRETLLGRSVCFRYFAQFKVEQRTAHERLKHIYVIDCNRAAALVVEYTPTPAGGRLDY